MNTSAMPAPSDVDEFEYAGLGKVPTAAVKSPRVGPRVRCNGSAYTPGHSVGGRRGYGVEYGDRWQISGGACRRLLCDDPALVVINRMRLYEYYLRKSRRNACRCAFVLWPSAGANAPFRSPRCRAYALRLMPCATHGLHALALQLYDRLVSLQHWPPQAVAPVAVAEPNTMRYLKEDGYEVH